MIRGYFNPDLSWPTPYVRVNLLLPGVTTEYKPVDFLIDTGSAVTSLQPRDALSRLGIRPIQLNDPSQWRGIRSLRGVGGRMEAFVTAASYAFDDDENGWEVITAEILVARFDLANFDADSERLPSVLGWDILRHFLFSLDHAGGRVTLKRRT